MYEDEKSTLELMPKVTEIQQRILIIQHHSFAVIDLLQECGRPLTLLEITEALDTPTDPHIELYELVSELLVSGYLDIELRESETRYSVRKDCEPRLPLPYTCFRPVEEVSRSYSVT